MDTSTLLNGICPYFTMFPIQFPYSVLYQKAKKGEWVLDPFCGRGTTNLASRLLGLPSIGFDTSPVAVAISEGKMANVTPDEMKEEARLILDEVVTPSYVPEGEFWEWAFQQDVLNMICRFREALLKDSSSDSRKALRAIIMGALHGPLGKKTQSYFSNQSPRTYAPKPTYAVKYWKSRNLHPIKTDVVEIVGRKSERYFGAILPKIEGKIALGDSRKENLYKQVTNKIKWIITSPPYYGMNTYIPDQWLRYWFVGGPDKVEYKNDHQLQHVSPEVFTNDLTMVWKNIRSICLENANLVIRFGGINDRKASPREMIEKSLAESGWNVSSFVSAGYATNGKRQAENFLQSSKSAIEEFDTVANIG
jgi:hypothetical protein